MVWKWKRNMNIWNLDSPHTKKCDFGVSPLIRSCDTEHLGWCEEDGINNYIGMHCVLILIQFFQHASVLTTSNPLDKDRQVYMKDKCPNQNIIVISTEGALRLPTTYDNHPSQSHPFTKPLQYSKQALDWPPMTTNDLQWIPMTTNDYQWLPMTTNDYQWLPMITQGNCCRAFLTVFCLPTVGRWR